MALGASTLLDYAGLAARVAQLSATLRSADLEPGERIALVAGNTPGYVETLFACWHAGLTAVPVNSKLHATELDYVLEHSGARWAFADAAWAATLGARAGRTAALGRVEQFGTGDYAALFADARMDEPAAVAPDDPAWLFYTSGTTGRPKGAILSHANLRAMSEAFLADVEPVTAGDAIVHAAPLSHGSGLYVVPHVARVAVNVVPESGGFDAAEVVSLLEAWRNVRLFAAPTMVKRLIGHPALGTARLDRLASIVCGGAPMYVEDCKAAHAALGSRLAQIYGQGESPMTITALSRERIAAAIAASDDARLGSVGVAQRGIALRIANEDGAALSAGEIG